MTRKLFGFLLGTVVFSFSCTTSETATPKLVVLMVLDHMRPDHLTRFDELYEGGFRWIMDNGTWFTNNHHEHGYTATGPAHFVIGTGQYPGPGGALGNIFYDRILEKKVNCVDDPNAKTVGGDGKARSFVRYETKGIGDWIKAADSQSKVFSIAGKDRSAVLMGGKDPDLAVYYNQTDRFITSDYYADELPHWLEKYNQNLNLSSYQDSLWTKSLSDSHYLEYAREDHYSGEVDTYEKDPYSPVFPIGFDYGTQAGDEIMGRPWFERIILDLGLTVVREEDLGKDEHPDLLCIGLSAMDWIIHDYGPFSQETMDACIKLDRYLADFIHDLDTTVGLEHIEFVLASDHGGLPLPEFQQEKGIPAGRIDRDKLNEAFEWIEDEITETYGHNIFVRDWIHYFFDLENLKKRNVPLSEPASIIKKYLLRVEGIKQVFTKREIMEGDSTDKIMFRLQKMIHPELSPDVVTLVSPGYLFRTPHGTSHGTPYDYDTHVPLIISRMGRTPRQISDHSKSVDIAPTIAKMLGVDIPVYCDGVPLKF